MSVLGLALLGSLWTAAAAGEVPPTRMAIMPLASNGLEERLVAVATDILVGELVAAGHWAVVTQDEIVALLGVEATRQALGCSELTCAVELGGALDARLLVTGNATRLADELSLRLSVFDTREMRLVGMVRRTMPAVEAKLEQGVTAAGRELVDQLVVRPDRWTPRQIASVSLLSVAGGALIAGVVAGVVGVRARNQLADGGLFQEEIDRLERRQRLGTIGAGVGAGVALLAGGAAAWLVFSSPAQTLAVRPWAADRALGLAAVASW